MRWISIQYF
uniref:Uncharacterized protein n=1 Tax=Anguilla anguilla TaxID=7936 RepID=A0A0E9SG45_ANGAN